MRFRMRWFGRGALWGLALYGAVGLSSAGYFALRGRPRALGERDPRPLSRTKQPIVSTLARVFVEDRVPDANRWAAAIVRACPTDDLGYVALVAAQIRRESHFLAPDLEWLFARVVPGLLHELGVPDPIQTVCPMQVQRWRLREVFERTLGIELEPHEVRQLAGRLETGVAACVAVLDPIVRDYIPDRRVRGWAHTAGVVGLGSPGDRPTLARAYAGTLPAERSRGALFQKMLSDLTATPLALDGVFGLHLAPSDRVRYFDRLSADLAVGDLQQTKTSTPFGGCGLGSSRRRCKILHHRTSRPASPTCQPSPSSSRTSMPAAVAAAWPRCKRCSTIWSARASRSMASPARGRLRPSAACSNHTSRMPRAATSCSRSSAAGTNRGWLRRQAWALASRLWRARHGAIPPRALVPDLGHGGFAQTVKGIGRISVEGYVAGSEAFFEDYLSRLLAYTGAETPPPGRRGALAAHSAAEPQRSFQLLSDPGVIQIPGILEFRGNS